VNNIIFLLVVGRKKKDFPLVAFNLCHFVAHFRLVGDTIFGGQRREEKKREGARYFCRVTLYLYRARSTAPHRVPTAAAHSNTFFSVSLSLFFPPGSGSGGGGGKIKESK
jgi:hypothetical protein